MTALSSKRLSFMPFSIADADDLFLIRGDGKAMAYWDWPADQTPDDTRAIARTMLGDIETGSTRVWTLRRLENDVFVGVADLGTIARNEADLGFMIRRDFWGNGYAFEAASAVMALAWDLGFARIGARIHAENARSRRLLEKLGFAVVAECRVEVRPGVETLCTFFSVANPAQGSSSLSQ